MNKSLLLLLCTTIISAVSAQQGFHIGASGTFNTTWILNQNNYGTLAPFTDPIVKQSEMDYNPTWGWNAGISLGYTFMHKKHGLGIKAEIQYNVTGQKYEDNFTGPAVIDGVTYGQVGNQRGRVNVKRDIKLNYVQIPVLFKYTTPKGRVAKFFVAVGPQFGFRTFGSEKVKVADIEYIDSLANFTPSQKFKTFDAGFALQFGTDIYATDHLYFEIGLSSYIGITDLNGKALQNLEWYSKNDVNYQKSHNFRAGLMVGVHYIIGKGRVSPKPVKNT